MTPTPLSDEHAALLRRAEALLSGDELEDAERQPLADLLTQIAEARADNAPALEELLDALEDLLFDLDLD